MKSSAYNRVWVLLAMFACALLTPLASADTLNVAVASNFKTTLERVQTQFEQTTGHRLNLIAGSSGSHYAQIMNGAPFDLFLSADAERPAALERAGRVTPAQRRIYALGRLALWSRDPAMVTSLQVLDTLLPAQRIAIANPRLAPYGEAAVATMQYLDVYETLKNQLVIGGNVSQAFQFVYSGSASLGIVAYAQVLAAPVAGSYVLIPDAAHPPIVQEMVLLTTSPASLALFDFLSSAVMGAVVEEAGYHAPAARFEP